MTPGDLVHLYAYQPHDSVLAKNIVHTGIFVDWVAALTVAGRGWVILVDGKPQTFERAWWKCKLVNNEQENVR